MGTKLLSYLVIAQQIRANEAAIKAAAVGEVVVAPPIRGVKVAGRKVKLNVAFEVEE